MQAAHLPMFALDPQVVRRHVHTPRRTSSRSARRVSQPACDRSGVGAATPTGSGAQRTRALHLQRERLSPDPGVRSHAPRGAALLPHRVAFGVGAKKRGGRCVRQRSSQAQPTPSRWSSRCATRASTARVCACSGSVLVVPAWLGAATPTGRGGAPGGRCWAVPSAVLAMRSASSRVSRARPRVGRCIRGLLRQPCRHVGWCGAAALAAGAASIVTANVTMLAAGTVVRRCQLHLSHLLLDRPWQRQDRPVAMLASMGWAVARHILPVGTACHSRRGPSCLVQLRGSTPMVY